MAATIASFGGRFKRYSEESAANTQLAMTVNPGTAFRLLYVLTTYSAAPTQGGVTHVLDSGVGAAYDNTLNTGSANARYGTYQPTGGLEFNSDDAIVVTAPAGGASITSQIIAVVEIL